MTEENKFKEIETKWQKWWEEHPELYLAQNESSRQKKYVLVEFPYPSGSGLHVGHAFAFTGGDVYARFKRMQGYNVLFPMGWDAFGLPTENYAIKMKRKPQEVTKENTDMFRSQMKRLAFSFDWTREINTTDPNYYKWTQWIFIQLFKKGLAYKQEMPINWCPSCKIGLANEEVVDGKCERCGTEVSRRNISQWVVKITDYADRLLDGLKNTDFIEKVKAAQINWIGKSEGARIRFKIKNSGQELEVFTTRPDTLYGATFMVVAPEHSIVSDIILRYSRPSGINPSDDSVPKITSETIEEIKKYVKSSRSKSDMERTELSKEKTGVFSGLYAINPVNNKEIPIWISDFVLASYGTGAIMSVPAHDERDFEFAMKFGLPIIPVIKQDHEVIRSYLMGASQISDQDLRNIGVEIVEKLESGSRKLQIPKTGIEKYEELIKEKLDNGFWNEYISDEIVFMFKDKKGEVERIELNLESEKKIDELAEGYNGKGWTQKQSVWAWIAENDWYRDYILSTDVGGGVMINSLMWDGLKPGEAIKKAIEWLKEKGIGEAKNSYHLRDWIFSRQHYWGEPIPMIFCPKDGWVPVPEEELPVKLPEVEAYEPTDDGQSPLSKISSFVNCQCPICGGEAKRETDTMPNWAGSDWYFLRYCDAQNSSKLAQIDILKRWMPVDVYVGGDEHNTLHLLYSRFIYQFLNDLGVVPKEIPEPYYHRMSHGVILGTDNNRMSKSKGNVIVPESVADKYGVDVIRMYLMFMGPFDGTMAWNEKTLMGVKRFLDRFEKFILSQSKDESASKQYNIVLINKLIKAVGEDIEDFGFNTAIAKQMKAINQLSIDNYELRIEEKQILVKLLAPFAPYTAEEMWSRLHQGSGESKSIHTEAWPEYEEKYLVDEKIKVAVAVNGKVRDELTITNDQLLMSNEIIRKAKELEKIKQWIDGKEIIREIYIEGKMVNLVIK
jgi:leucyl-tRNA synthetase